MIAAPFPPSADARLHTLVFGSSSQELFARKRSVSENSATAGHCGLIDTADRKSAELEAALRDASDGGRTPIVFDTSPCAYRMKRYLAGRLTVG